MEPTINKDDLVATRDLIAEDKNFILATMLRGLYYGGTHFSEMRKPVFMAKYHDIVKDLLDKDHKSTVVKIACLKEDPTVVLGYVILSLDQTVLHWAFTKKSWRKIGIIKDLIPNTVSKVTHVTKVGLSLIKQKDLEYDPFYRS